MKIRIAVAGALLGMSFLALLAGCGNRSPVASCACTPSHGKAPLNVSFDASGSSDSDGSIESYVWDFGDDVSGIGISAKHRYSTPDTYVIHLTVTDDDENTGSTTRTIYVFPAVPAISSPPAQTAVTKADAIGHAKVLVWKYLGEPRYDVLTITRATNTIADVWDVSGRFAYIGSPTRAFDAIIEKESNDDWCLLGFSWKE